MAANTTSVTVTLDAESKRLLRRIADALDGGSSADRAFADADRDEKDSVGHVRFTENTPLDLFTHWEGE
jgi:hypothetical protein